MNEQNPLVAAAKAKIEAAGIPIAAVPPQSLRIEPWADTSVVLRIEVAVLVPLDEWQGAVSDAIAAEVTS